MIAMALSCHPELLIADEPTTALDVTIQAQIMDLLFKLRDKMGMGIILITHDFGVVAEAAEHVAVMYCGKIVEAAPVRELFRRPLHPYSRGLIESIPRMDVRLNRLPIIKGAVPNPLSMPPGCSFSSRCEHSTDKCKPCVPALSDIGGRQVRCFLHSQAIEPMEAEEAV
jgi:peptide/nickel transport system ATP-binding protein